MYKLLIYQELEEDTYNKLIDFACGKSDAFMLIIYKYSNDIDRMYKKPDKKLVKNKELYLKILDSIERAKKQKIEENKISEKSLIPFSEKLKPYLIKKRNSPIKWPGMIKWLGMMEITPDDNYIIDICVYKVCNEVKTYLAEPKGLFNWKYPYFPDDLCFFKDGFCWFSTVAHEGYACMYIKNSVELEILKKLGIEFKVTECNEDKVDLFYEDYNL